MNFAEIVCPISNVRVDSNVNRLTTFNVVILIALYLYTSIPYFIIIVTSDYFIRAFLKQKYSPLKWIALGLSKVFNLYKKEINVAPKVFASRLGFLCAFATMIFYYTGMPTTSLIIALMLFSLTIMDSIFNYCVGCLIYHTVVFPFYERKLKN